MAKIKTTIIEENSTNQIEWWKDTALVRELDKEYEDWKSGKDKGFTIEQLKASISRLRKKKYG